MILAHPAPVSTLTPVEAGASTSLLARRARWLARSWLWEDSTLKNCRKCGRVPVSGGNLVQVRANGQAVGYAGLASCGSVWVCPVCNGKIQSVRRLEVSVALLYALQDGGAAFGAYTLRHGPESPLEPTWRALTACWAAVGRDRHVRELRASLGHAGFIRAAEVTVGRNGWHPHLHPLHLFRYPVTDRQVAALHSAEFSAWSSAARRLGLDAPTEAGQDLHRVTGRGAADDLGKYFGKVTWEMTSTQTKSDTRASGSVTPWALLRAASEEGDAMASELWQEWEAASYGKRQLTWSRGLRKRCGLDVEATNEEIAAAEIGTKEDTGFAIADWSPIAARPRLGADLLSVIGAGQNWAAGRQFALRNGLAVVDL